MVVVTMCTVSHLGCLEQNHLDRGTCNPQNCESEIVNMSLVLTKALRFLIELNLFKTSQVTN
jgi:hypothetical protein